MLKNMERLQEFINGSKTFGSITFVGCYSMSINTFLKLFNHYKNTGENLLDIYSEHVYLNWDYDEASYSRHYMKEITPDEFCEIQRGLSKLRRLNICDVDDLRTARVELRKQLLNYYNRIDNELTQRRRQACLYTSKPKVKKYIKEKFGWKCIKCGSIENVSIDHIIPILKGGKDELFTLQPLCKSCNSNKGAMKNSKFMKING